jgi:hypothetical protein
LLGKKLMNASKRRWTDPSKCGEATQVDEWLVNAAQRSVNAKRRPVNETYRPVNETQRSDECKSWYSHLSSITATALHINPPGG